MPITVCAINGNVYHGTFTLPLVQLTSVTSENCSIESSSIIAAVGHRRLENQRPDLHKKVLDGEITVHKACLEAGFRKKVFSISGEPAPAARTIAKNYSPDDIKLLIEELKTLL